LILRKIIKIVSTRWHILKLKCIKFDFGWGSAPDPAGGSLQRSPRLPSWFKRHTSKGREGRKDGMEGQGRGEGRGGDLLLRRGGEREEMGGLAPQT